MTLLQKQLKRLIVVDGTIVDCELHGTFAYSYHQRQVAILSHSNIIKFEMNPLRGIVQKQAAWQSCQAVFCLFMHGIWKNWRDWGQILDFYSARRVRISLGGVSTPSHVNLPKRSKLDQGHQ